MTKDKRIARMSLKIERLKRERRALKEIIRALAEKEPNVDTLLKEIVEKISELTD